MTLYRSALNRNVNGISATVFPDAPRPTTIKVVNATIAHNSSVGISLSGWLDSPFGAELQLADSTVAFNKILALEVGTEVNTSTLERSIVLGPIDGAGQVTAGRFNVSTA